MHVKVYDYSPAQDLVFHIFSSRMMMAARWERSPVSLKMFMFMGAPAAVNRLKSLKSSVRLRYRLIYDLTVLNGTVTLE